MRIVSSQSIHPYNGELMKSFEEFSDNQLEAAIAKSAACFKTWHIMTFRDSATVDHTAGAIMRVRYETLARPVTVEMSKLIDQARGAVLLSADIIDYNAENAQSFLAPQQLRPTSGEAEVESTPIGVLLGIQPCNLLYYQLARSAGRI